MTMGPKLRGPAAAGNSNSSNDSKFLGNVKKHFDEAADESAKEYGNLVMQEEKLKRFLHQSNCQLKE